MRIHVGPPRLELHTLGWRSANPGRRAHRLKVFVTGIGFDSMKILATVLNMCSLEGFGGCGVLRYKICWLPMHVAIDIALSRTYLA